MSSSASGLSSNTRARDSKAALIANDGFSVVAPIKHDRAVFDVRQERILLRLVEAVNFVDEQQRALAVDAACARALA